LSGVVIVDPGFLPAPSSVRRGKLVVIDVLCHAAGIMVAAELLGRLTRGAQ
jgi:hypothetical protein